MKATDLKIGETYYYATLGVFLQLSKISIIRVSEPYHSFGYECEGCNVKYRNIISDFVANMFIPNDVSDFDADAWRFDDANVLQRHSYEFIAADKASMAKAIKGYFHKYKPYYDKQSFLKIMDNLKKI